MPPRVLILHNVVAPYRLPLFEALSEDFDITVFFCSEEDPARKWKADLQNYSFDYTILPSFDVGIARVNYTMPLRLFGDDYDAVILSDTPEAMLTNIAAFLYTKRKGIPYAVWTEVLSETEGQDIYSFTPFLQMKTALISRVRGLLYRYADGFIAYSAAAAEYLVDHDVSRGDIASGIQVVPRDTIVQSGVDVAENGLIVLFVGYLDQRKGVDTLIRAYCRASTPDSKLVIVGTGPAETELKSLAGDASDIEFTGYVSEAEKVAYYDAAELFVLPSRHDAWGLVVNEAMHHGLPVIVSSSAGAEELVNRYNNGYVVPPDDADALANRIEELLTDPEQREMLADRSSAASDVTDVETGIQPFQMMLEKLLS